MIIKDWKRDILTIPNVLSMFRFVLIPVYIIIYLNASKASQYYIAGGILSFSCLTDLIDGKIAREFNMVSNLGKILDPLADKATQLSLILCLAIRYPVLWNLVALFILKESFQLIAGVITLRRGKMLTGALLSGKVCTVVLFLSLILLVLIPTIPLSAVTIISAIDAAFMLVTLGHYIYTYSLGTANIKKLDQNNPK